MAGRHVVRDGLSVVLARIRVMAYDRELADRIRMLIGGDPALIASLTEKKMFGGLAFLIGGNDTTSATVAVMRGRAMPGWLRGGAAEVAADAGLIPWVERGTAYARPLPAKG